MEFNLSGHLSCRLDFTDSSLNVPLSEQTDVVCDRQGCWSDILVLKKLGGTCPPYLQ